MQLVQQKTTGLTTFQGENAVSPVENGDKTAQKKRVTFLQLSDFQCGVTGNRTRDTRIFSPLLYQLSYDTISLYFFRVISSSYIASSVGHYREVTPSILARSSRTHHEINHKFQSTFG